MMPRKTFRFGTRPRAPSDAPMPMCDDDTVNLENYAAKIEETVGLLQQEIAAVKAGNLDVVGTLFEEKSRLLKWLELQTPVVQPFLTGDVARSLNIKGRLMELRQHIEEDGAILSRMSVAARTILREFEKIHDRNGLGGTYGKSGEKRGSSFDHRLNVNKVL